MKVILSRKGFDSSNGGIVSPIFEDGTMISMPIPSDDKDKFRDLNYKGTSYADILYDLGYKGVETCHLDPDLDSDRRIKPVNGWRAAFGQINSAASYLKNVGLSKGDIFLFFGNFHQVEYVSGHYKYVKKTGDFYKDKDLQVIWGYLQIGDIIDDNEVQKEFWWHPHSSEKRRNNKTNVIFTASERLSLDKSRPGYGILPFDKKRVLTGENCNKATWKMNEVYDPDHILCNRKNSARNPDNGIYYADIWQQIALCESKECIK
ncbi:MAG: hypothetical protein K6G03_01885, partial [Lachnospiraceae bacterium]|nr:hypothetical protein [Lachnospiraceae bacterium]